LRIEDITKGENPYRISTYAPGMSKARIDEGLKRWQDYGMKMKRKRK